MINIIIYEDNKDMQTLYKKTLNQYFKRKRQDFIIHVFDHYSKNLESKFRNIVGKKIYIMDIEVPGKSGLDLARNIRNSGDWMSPLIVISSYAHLKNTSFTSKVLMLDFICKREPVEKRLVETLDIIYDIVDEFNNYTFQNNGSIFHIPYDDILYFEKDLNDNYTFIHTKSATYKTTESIIQINNKLTDNSHFFRTHRSCIVNTYNVDYLGCDGVVFKNGDSINLITSHSKNLLKKILNS